MRLSEDIKPISYLKNNAAKVIKTITENKRPMIITQNGEAKAVVQDIKSYDDVQEMAALSKLITISEAQVEKGNWTPQEEVFEEIRQKLDLLK
ncbi:MAG: type II toxin-antitoxin system Phd/YefM family antitoxin [Candidatus Thioglobus sp.]|nr:type II toxin-antitoxin system Phd/YefM family antitoxin [Candidatus Thioglobus sp.]